MYFRTSIIDNLHIYNEIFKCRKHKFRGVEQELGYNYADL